MLRFAIFLSLVFVISSPVLAQTTVNNNVSGGDQTMAAAEAGSSPLRLSGSVKQEVLVCERELKDMGQTLDKIEHALIDIVHEVNRYQAVLTDPPENDEYDVTQMYSAVEGQGDLLSPRQNRLKLYTSDLDQLIPILASDIKAVEIPKSFPQELSVQWSVARGTLDQVEDDTHLLENLCAGPTYQNDLISKAARRVHEEVQGIVSIHKRVLHELKDKKN